MSGGKKLLTSSGRVITNECEHKIQWMESSGNWFCKDCFKMIPAETQQSLFPGLLNVSRGKEIYKTKGRGK